VRGTFFTRPIAPVIVWLGVVGAALVGSLVVADVAAPLAAGGAVIALSLLQAPLQVRLLTALGMLPIALLDSTPAWAWIVGGGAIALASGLWPRSAHPLPEVNGDLQRHLAWCRRREEPAHLLVVPLNAADDGDLAHLLESFRITDSVTLGRGADGSELYALLDAFSFDRQGLERRLAERLNGQSLGWASFPEDGVTLQTLIEHARTMRRAERSLAVVAEGTLVEAAPSGASLEHATGRS
jgi:hypothetical protein